MESVSSCQAIPVPKSMSRHDRLCTVKRQRAIPRTGLLMAPDVQSRTVPALSAGHILTLGYLKIVITTGLSRRRSEEEHLAGASPVNVGTSILPARRPQKIEQRGM